MVALTPRVLKKNVWNSRLSRNSGASYAHDIVVTDKNDKASYKKIMDEGLRSMGSNDMGFVEEMAGEGLYPFGSGVCRCGTAVSGPFGMGIISNFIKKASSVIRSVVPASLRRAALDYGKKKALEMLPQVSAKVKEEINKRAPGLAVRFSDRLGNKLPQGIRGPVGSLIQRGAQHGLSALNTGFDQAERMAMARLGGKGLSAFGNGLTPFGNGLTTFGGGGFDMPSPAPSSYPTNFSQSQLNFMQSRGEDLERQRQAGNVPKRLVLDQHSRSLLDTIIAEKGYQHAKSQDALEQMGIQQYPSSSEHMGPQLMLAAKPKRAPRAKKAPTGKKAGRPKGSTTGKGIVYL